MKIHSLNCGTFCPPNLSRWIGRLGRGFPGHRLPQNWNPDEETRFAEAFRELVTHVLLIEMGQNLILIDTGVGKRQMLEQRRTWKGKLQGALLGLRPDPEMTAAAQLPRAGFTPADVTDVILTHLDTDHVGGLCDFPNARAHLFRGELEAAQNPRNRFERLRFQKHLWEDHRHFELYDAPGDADSHERFHGLPLTPLRGIPDELRLISLPGHTLGHGGILLRSRNLVFAGDACVNEVALTDGYQPIPVRLYESMTTANPESWRRSLAGLKTLCQCGVTVCCAHDRAQFERLKDSWNEPGRT